MSNSVIGKVWSIEQEILDVIHNLCAENQLRYSLFYGTLIGAVRHKGFIPWDDDIDIVMPRKDYDEFKRIWFKKPVEGYILQDYNTDKDYTNNFMKIRKDGTTFLQSEEERSKKYHKGVFVDIFPADRLAPTYFTRKIQYVASAINLLYSRGFSSGSGGAVGAVEKALLILPAKFRPFWRDLMEKCITYWNNTNETQYFCPCTIVCCRKYYPKDTFDNLKTIEFNGKEYFSVQDTDTVLRVEYNDYMQLPPEEERVWKHHPLVIDFEHNYEEL